MSLLNEMAPIFSMFLPCRAAIITIVARNPIHAILWLIATFLTASGLMFYHYSLGFTCSLIIIVYIGAIAVLFLFIVMMVPIKKNVSIQNSGSKGLLQSIVFLSVYMAGCGLMLKNVVAASVTSLGEFWLSFGNQIDHQSLLPTLPTKEIQSLTLTDLHTNDLALYGAQLYQSMAYPILLTGLVLLFVLVAAIVLCREE